LLPIGEKGRLEDEDDGAGELCTLPGCTLCITGHNNGPLLGVSNPKSEERLTGRNGA